MILDVIVICVLYVFIVKERVEPFDTTNCVSNPETRAEMDAVKVRREKATHQEVFFPSLTKLSLISIPSLQL